MRWIILVAVAAALSVFNVSVPNPMGSTKAYANKMDGKSGGGQNSANYGPSRYEKAAKKSGMKNGKKP